MLDSLPDGIVRPEVLRGRLKEEVRNPSFEGRRQNFRDVS